MTRATLSAPAWRALVLSTWRAAVLGGLLLLLVLVAQAQTGLANTPWPMFLHDPQHTGRSPYSGPATAAQKWAFTTGGIVASSPVIDSNGTVYVGADTNKLYAVNPDGTQKWAFSTGNWIYASPAIGADGTVYISSEDHKLYAIHPDGTQSWVAVLDAATPANAWVQSSPTIGTDGTIYVGTEDGKLYAINTDGSQKWAFTTADTIVSSPAIGVDGTIYVGSRDHNLYAINPDGMQKWAFNIGNNILASPAIGSDGTVYVGAYDNKVYAVNPNGTQKWVFATGGYVPASPALGTDGTVYIGSQDFKFYAINTDGTQRWVFATGAAVDSSSAIGADGTVYVGSNDGKVYAINPDGTQKWAFATGGAVKSSPAIGVDGTIYVGSRDGKLYAIGSGTQPLTITPATASVMVSGTQQFTATPANGVSWTCTGGTMTAAGLFTAGNTPGTFTVTATSPNGTAGVPVTIADVAFAVTPYYSILARGATQQFVPSQTVGVTWTATGGNISATGLFTAGNTPGHYEVKATSPNGMATIPVTIEGTIGTVTTVGVPGFACPYLAGLPDTIATPDQAPVGMDVTGMTVIKITALGAVDNNGYQPPFGPDANGSGGLCTVAPNAQFGVSLAFAPINSLMGVFLDVIPPPATDFPPTITGTTTTPLMRQSFQVGTGPITITVPPGATRLFLGSQDAWGWPGNSGHFTVAVTDGTLRAGNVTLLSPPSGTSNVNPTMGITLVWQAASDATGYEVQYTTDIKGIWTSALVTGTSLPLTALNPSSTYTWRVRARNNVGNGAWSTQWSFTTAGPPAAPTLTAPLNGATDVDFNGVNLTWTARANATSYTVQYATENTFAAPTSVPTTTATLLGLRLQPRTTYFWRVNASNALGASAWSPTGSFTTSAPPGSQPDLLLQLGPEQTWAGSFIYTQDAQTVAQTVAPGGTATYWLALRNNGAYDETLTVQASASGAEWAVAFFDASGANITPSVTGAGWQVTLEPSVRARITVKVSALNTAIATNQATTVMATSATTATLTDAVSLLTHARPVSGDGTPAPPSTGARADLMILRPDGTGFIGQHIYGSAESQRRIAYTCAGVPVTYVIRLANDGTADGTFTLAGPAAPTGWTATYYDDTGADITAAMTGAGRQVTLAVGALRDYTVRVAPGAAVGINSSCRAAVTATLTGATTPGDIVEAVTQYMPLTLIPPALGIYGISGPFA